MRNSLRATALARGFAGVLALFTLTGCRGEPVGGTDPAEHLPPGLTAAELDDGYVALTDGRSRFGWATWEREGSRPTPVPLDRVRVAGEALIVDLGVDERLILNHGLAAVGGFGNCRVRFGRGVSSNAAPGETCVTVGVLNPAYPLASSCLHPRDPAPIGDHGLSWSRWEIPFVDGAYDPEELDPAGERLGASSGGRLMGPDREIYGPGDFGFGFSASGCDRAGLRHLIVRPDTTPLPLTVFTPVPGNAAKVARGNDALRLTSGPGFLRSDKQYGDFVLQCEVKLHGTDSNSGLFFRTMEPTAENPSNGYEVQLQNTLGPGGRTDPDDYGDGFGTGGIFRRQPARYVNADDGEWFALTLVCVGNRMATWVNGLQVTDFTDDRDPDSNPRKGRRDAPGYLVLQAHDPGTDVSFRNFRVQELDAAD